jgi:hypothetical protein
MHAMYIRYFWQGCHQIYGHTQSWPTLCIWYHTVSDHDMEWHDTAWHNTAWACSPRSSRASPASSSRGLQPALTLIWRLSLHHLPCPSLPFHFPYVYTWSTSFPTCTPDLPHSLRVHLFYLIPYVYTWFTSFPTCTHDLPNSWRVHLIYLIPYVYTWST